MSKKAECTLTCPKCHKSWGKLRYSYGSFVKAEDVTILKGEKKLNDGDTLACSECSYEYTNYDVILNIQATGGMDG